MTREGFSHDGVEAFARNAAILRLDRAVQPRKADLVIRPGGRDERLDQAGRGKAHVLGVEAPGVISADGRSLFDERDPRLGRSRQHRECNERILQAAPDEYVVVRIG